MTNQRMRPVASVIGFLLLSYLPVSLPAADKPAQIVAVEVLVNPSRSVLGSTVIPYREVNLSAQIPGVVQQVAGEVGAMFISGDLLVQIDEATLQAQRNAALAEIEMARSAGMNAQTQYQREQVSPRSKDVGGMPGFGMPAMFDMMAVRPFADAMMNNYDSDAARQADLANSSAAVTQAQAGLQRAYAQLQELDAALLKAKSVAPFAGMILSKQVEVGDTVQPGQPLLTYADMARRRLQADVPSGMVGNLREGMQVPARINDELETQATVAQIFPLADPARHTVVVKFDLPAEVTPPFGAYAEIHLPEQDSGGEILAIPRTALLRGGSLPGVLVVSAENTSGLRMVRIGSDLAMGRVEVTAGLKAGERIIDSPPLGVGSGWMPPAAAPTASAPAN